MKYQHFIDYWYENFPKSRPLMASRMRADVDPYAHVDMD